jgi:hypothetical protein
VPHRTIEGDLEDLVWNGDPIQLLFLDVLYVRFIDRMPWGTYVFLLERPILESVLRLDVRRLAFEQQLDWLDRARDRWPGNTAGMIELSKARLYGLNGFPDKARETVAHARMLSDTVAVQVCADLTLELIPYDEARRNAV